MAPRPIYYILEPRTFENGPNLLDLLGIMAVSMFLANNGRRRSHLADTITCATNITVSCLRFARQELSEAAGYPFYFHLSQI